MTALTISFWLAAACVVFTYCGYPLLIAAIARLRRRSTASLSVPAVPISVVLTVYNEANTITARVRELLAQLSSTTKQGELIVVSDGSTDSTVGLARQSAPDDNRLRVIARTRNTGKAAALSDACSLAHGEILVLADARQSWAPDALRRLLENFADPTVGGVSGELILQSQAGSVAGVGLYWRYEKWLRRQESRLHSTVGVTGAISAVRKCLFSPIPPGTVLDDVYWPLCVTMNGYRVVHDARAKAFDCLPGRACDELRRKIRTLSGNFQLLMCLPGAVLPWRNPVWFQVICHKLLRLLVPWALLIALLGSLLLHGPIYRLALAAQASFYLFALLGLFRGLSSRFRFASAATAFVVLNAAAWVAFWVWLSGRTTHSWYKVTYQVAEA